MRRDPAAATRYAFKVHLVWGERYRFALTSSTMTSKKASWSRTAVDFKSTGRPSCTGRALEAVEAPRVGRDRPTRLIPATFRYQTISAPAAVDGGLRRRAPAAR